MEQVKRPTVLEEYRALRQDMETSMQEAIPSPGQLWAYQELLYRISVIEVLSRFFAAAPFTVDGNALLRHFQMLSGYLQHLIRERRYNDSASEKVQKMRQTSHENLCRIVQNHRARFQRYAPHSMDQYQRDIGNVINTVLPAWLQYRNTLINIQSEEEKDL